MADVLNENKARYTGSNSEVIRSIK